MINSKRKTLLSTFQLSEQHTEHGHEAVTLNQQTYQDLCVETNFNILLLML